MRLIAELLVIALLIAAGWSKSFKERLSGAPRAGETKTRVVHAPTSRAPKPVAGVATQSVVQPIPTGSPSGAWMWDKDRRAPLDPPSRKP